MLVLSLVPPGGGRYLLVAFGRHGRTIVDVSPFGCSPAKRSLKTVVSQS